MTAPDVQDAVGTDRVLPRLPGRVTFVVAAGSLLCVFVAAGSPISLFNLYRHHGLSGAVIASAAVLYFVAAAFSLLVLGRLSDHLGRRPVAIVAVLSSAAGTLLLTQVDGPQPLLLGRVFQGLACGAASGTLGAFVVDTAPARPRWLPALVVGSAPMLGIPVGAVGAGVLVEYAPAPRVLAYLIVSAALVLGAALLLAAPESIRRRPGAIRSLLPRFVVPAGSGRLMFAAGSAYVATWAVGGFFQAFGPTVAEQQLGSANAVVAAAVFASIMILNPLGGPLGGGLSPTAGLRIGIAAYLAAIAGVLLALEFSATVPFFLAALLAGIAQGVISTGGNRALLAATDSDERAGLLSTLFLISYCGAALPGLVAGQVADHLSVVQIALGYVLLGSLGCLAAFIGAPPGRRRSRCCG
ncbi:putative MFS family arabinose efflux permease [Kribbella sp. VKM Ac-2527]|uniref:Putative MFS family arabinose efflux permease n=1 Tax=Kribbella caucasensis TaxID=2512215 RepID=A0A4R6KQ11_9ACTN|nr:MFS transporter [Kribbella sp. VKM Ac-2527]TDO51699.1 putative MFS family arabinose efflux permease [Kribbella sp. VKM Ac-2527]